MTRTLNYAGGVTSQEAGSGLLAHLFDPLMDAHYDTDCVCGWYLLDALM
ncbi:MAG: hypothetical protein ACYSUI_03545 [Planctomycetota bacterium]